MRTFRTALGFALLVAGVSHAPPAWAQGARPGPLVETPVGFAGFVDEVMDKRLVTGGAARVFVTPRAAIGPEFAYLAGRDGNHDWTLTGNVSFDLMHPSPARTVTPYLIGGYGLLSQTQQVGTGPFTSHDWTASGGIGARISAGRRVYIAPEFRMGFEPEIRLGLTVGIRTGR